MSEEERLGLNNYMEDLYQAMQIGNIVYEPKRSTELYNLINKVLEENKKYKEVINKAIEAIEDSIEDVISGKSNCFDCLSDFKSILNILKEVEHE